MAAMRRITNTVCKELKPIEYSRKEGVILAKLVLTRPCGQGRGMDAARGTRVGVGSEPSVRGELRVARAFASHITRRI